MSKRSIDVQSVLDEGKSRALGIFVLAAESVRISVCKVGWMLAEV